MRKRLLIGFAIAVACLYFAFRGVSIGELMAVLRTASLPWIVLSIGVYAAGYLFRTLRWKILLAPVKAIPAAQLAPPLLIGFFANNILPFRMGELVRAHFAGQKFHMSRTASLGTILLERIYDTISFLATFSISALFFAFPPSIKKAAGMMAIACAVLVIVLLVSVHFHDLLHRIIERTKFPGGWRLKIRSLFTNFVHGVSGVKRVFDVIQVSSLSFVVWTLEGTGLYFIARAFPIPFRYPESFFLLFFLGLSVTLPQAPGYVGTYELFGVTALSLLGIPRTQGLPVILAIHGLQFGFIAALGLWALWKEGISITALGHLPQLAHEAKDDCI